MTHHCETNILHLSIKYVSVRNIKLQNFMILPTFVLRTPPPPGVCMLHWPVSEFSITCIYDYAIMHAIHTWWWCTSHVSQWLLFTCLVHGMEDESGMLSCCRWYLPMQIQFDISCSTKTDKIKIENFKKIKFHRCTKFNWLPTSCFCACAFRILYQNSVASLFLYLLKAVHSFT